jgi:hypothetical protein
MGKLWKGGVVLIVLLACILAFAAMRWSKPAPQGGAKGEASSSQVAEEECDADAAWFSGKPVAKPVNTEPTRGDDCQFYQRAMQHFLYAVQGNADSPRFLSYQSYADLFGADLKAGLVSGARDPNGNQKLMVLAPRLEKAAQTAEAGDIFQAGSNAVLLDEAGHPIFYNIFVDPDFAKVIKDNGYNDPIRLPATARETELPPGMIEFKAAWQIVDEAHLPTDRIVVRAQVPWLKTEPSPLDPTKMVLVIDKAHGLRPVTVALIGLHVVFTTVNHPEMIWATFEYSRNAPSTRGNPTDAGTKCPNSGDPADAAVADDGKGYLLYTTGDPPSGINKKPRDIRVVDDLTQTFAPSGSIARVYPFSACSTDPAKPVTEIDGAIAALNESFAKQNKSARLAKYTLVGAVWLDDPKTVFRSDATFTDAMLGGEDRLSSVAMESYTQTSFNNCFACHNTVEKGKLGPMRISVSHLFRRFANR